MYSDEGLTEEEEALELELQPEATYITEQHFRTSATEAVAMPTAVHVTPAEPAFHVSQVRRKRIRFSVPCSAA